MIDPSPSPSRLGPCTRLAGLALALLALRCGSSEAPLPAAEVPLRPEAGFVTVPPREVVVKGSPLVIEAEARLFVNLRPADEAPGEKPIFVLFNGFAAEVVRAFGTGPTTVAEGGAVVENPLSLTKSANLLYVDPRQAGYSYDVLPGRSPEARDCANTLFNEYVDAADVLLAVLGFLGAHPALRGPVYWVGESYGGARIQWILAYLRGRWALADYQDPTLEQALSRVTRTGSLRAGQILLQPWLMGKAHTEAIAAVCVDPALLAAVGDSVGAPCAKASACACADDHKRSRYAYTYPIVRQKAREFEASQAHTDPLRAEALLGVPVTAIAGLAADERGKGFKCSPPDAETPSDAPLVAALGALPAGQVYYVPYSPLQPGKELAPFKPDWRAESWLGLAFADNLRDVPTFITDGPRDLVVPAQALAPALAAVLGEGAVDASSPGTIVVKVPEGERVIPLFRYPEAGHMVTMIAPAEVARDVAAWLTGAGKAP